MNYTILNTIKEEATKESSESASRVEVTSTSNDDPDDLFSGLYDEYENTTFTDCFEDKYGLKSYTLSTAYMVSLKEARRSKEVKTPFAIVKRQDKKSKPSEFDSIYRTYKKIKYSDYKQGVRLGFVQGSSTFKNIKFNPNKTDKFVGIANQDIPIRKKKGFNQKKLGYIKLKEETDAEDYYVEVTQSRGILWMILTALIAAALVLIINGHNWNGWNINWDSLTVLKTTISEFTEQSLMSIYHQSDVRLDGSTLRLDLTSDQSDDSEYKISIYIGDENTGTKIYEGTRLKAGSSIPSLDIQGAADLQPGTYNCTIVCDVYKSTGRHLGSIKSYFTMEV